RVDRIEAIAKAGKLEVAFVLRGEGPHTITFQLASDPGRTATIPLVGSRAAERRDTVFSTLGAEVLGSALATEDGREVRGLYLRRGGTSTSPLRLDRVDVVQPKLTATTDLETLTIAVIDPTLARHPGAIDPAVAPHPAHTDEGYRHGEQLFLDGNFAAALETFTGARVQSEVPHPNYAYFIACCHARLGNTAAGLAMLRTAVREGWSDFNHLRTDPDLAALHGEPEFAAIASDGGVRIIETSLAKGESLAIDVAAPLAYLAIGAIVDGQPWEGYAAIIAPAAVKLAVEAPAKVAPGDTVTIDVVTTGEASVYVVIKDARLLSTDTPTSRLAGQLKAHVDRMRETVLGTGSTRESLDELIPEPPMNLPFGGPPSMPSAMMLGGMAQPMPQSFGPPEGMARPMAYSSPPAMPAPMAARAAGMGPRPNAPGGAPRGMAAPPPKSPPPPRAAVEESPEVVFAGLVHTRDGKATVTATLGAAFADYVVEAFAIAGADWSAAATRFRAERVVFAEFEMPRFVHADDVAIGRLTAGSGAAGMTIAITRDGVPVPITADGDVVAPGATLRGPRAELAFLAGPGDYTVELRDAATGELVRRTARVDEPSKLRRIARSVRILRPGDRVSRRDDPSIIALRALPGLDKPFTVLCEATADYGHACCEQTAAKMFAACAVYTFAGHGTRRDRAEEIILAGVRRERTMFLPRRGFKMYPDSPNTSNEYWGSLTARYLWNLELLRPTATKALVAAIDDALEMAADATTAYKLAWPPRDPRTPADAYAALKFGSDANAKASAVITLRSWAAGQSTRARGAVGFRAEAAYTAAGLFHAGGVGGPDVPAALAIANTVVGALGPEGRLYSTVDSVAAIAMMSEIHAAGLVGQGDKAVIDGRTVAITDAIAEPLEIAAATATVAVEVTRIVEEDWDAFTAKLPITITTMTAGRPTARIAIGDPLDLHVRIDSGYQPGDLVWVALPDSLSRVIGGGQVKRFSIDLAGKPEVTIPLAATGLTIDRAGDEAPQHFAVCVRNMFEEERAGNPGPLDITVVPPRGGDEGLLGRAAAAIRKLIS
ncbi:MAG: hypothetical protein ABI867_10710, partial [Kofleriaceae bacterium]